MVNWYTDHGYSPVNAELRGHAPEFERDTDDQMLKDYGMNLSNKQVVQHLDQIIARAPKRKKVLKLYRGETNPEHSDRLLAMKVGEHFVDKGFVSTSLDPSFAFYAFAQARQQQSNMISLYLVPPSVPGAGIVLPNSDQDVEKEFVLGRGCTFTLRERRPIPVKNPGYNVKEIMLLIWDVK